MTDLNVREIAPTSTPGYSNYYNDNNFIGAGIDNSIIDSTRCSIIQGSSNYISGKYNCHIIGDYLGHKYLDDANQWAKDLQDNTFNVACLNGMYCWGPIFAERGFASDKTCLFGDGTSRLALHSQIFTEQSAITVPCIDFRSTINQVDLSREYYARISLGVDLGGSKPSMTNDIHMYGDSSDLVNLNVEGDVVSFYSSDKRLKNNISNLNNCLPKILKLDPISFEWNDKQNAYKGKDIGLIAQQVKEIAPEIVTERKNGYLAMKYEKVIPLLVGAIQDQQKIIEEMREEINQLKER